MGNTETTTPASAKVVSDQVLAAAMAAAEAAAGPRPSLTQPDPAGRCAEHTRRDCPTCYPRDEYEGYDVREANRAIRRMVMADIDDTMRRTGTAWRFATPGSRS